MDKLLNSLKVVLKARDFDDYSDEYLLYEINQAICMINKCRNFTPTNEKPYDKKYEYLIIPMCISSIAKIGAEGEIVHSENGIVRNYNTGDDYPKELISQIIPLIK